MTRCRLPSIPPCKVIGRYREELRALSPGGAIPFSVSPGEGMDMRLRRIHEEKERRIIKSTLSRSDFFVNTRA
jgi:hypothetical protein